MVASACLNAIFQCMFVAGQQICSPIAIVLVSVLPIFVSTLPRVDARNLLVSFSSVKHNKASIPRGAQLGPIGKV